MLQWHHQPYQVHLPMGALAAAAWPTSWPQPVDDSGFAAIEEPPSSNSKSSASEATWRRSVWFWALPVWPSPWSPAHWFEMSPVLVTVND